MARIPSICPGPRRAGRRRRRGLAGRRRAGETAERYPNAKKETSMTMASTSRSRGARRARAGLLALGSLFALAAVLAGATSGRAADGPLTLRTELPLGFRAHDIIVEGALAYVATERGLVILDLADPL